MEDVKIHLYLNPFLSIYSLNGRACLQSNIVYSRCTVEEWCGCSVDRTTEHVNEQVRECTNEYSEEKEGSQSQVQSVFAVCVLADDECALCPSERVRWEQKVESEIWKNNKERNEDNFKCSVKATASPRRTRCAAPTPLAASWPPMPNTSSDTLIKVPRQDSAREVYDQGTSCSLSSTCHLSDKMVSVMRTVIFIQM
jgi:hypothetical protein